MRPLPTPATIPAGVAHPEQVGAVTRREALAAMAAAFVLIAAGLVWLLGPYGLILAGLVLAATVLFGVNITEGPRGEAVDGPAGPRHAVPVQRR